MQGFGGENFRIRDDSSDLLADERIILNLILLKQDGGMEWINVALRAVVYTVMNLRVL